MPEKPEGMDTPYIEQPHIKDDDHETNGLNCFLDGNRECGADCMAYISSPPDILGLEGQPANCFLLLSSHQLTHRVGVLAKAVVDASKTHPKPPNPTGG